MTMRPLPPGLAPDAVEKLRWDTFGQRQSSSVRSQPDLVRFTAARGFVLRAPVPGLHYPSILAAAAGRPQQQPVADEQSRKAEVWIRESVVSQRLLHAAVLSRRASLIDFDFIGDFFALSGHRGEPDDHVRLCKKGGLSAEASALCGWLVREGHALARSELAQRMQIQGALGEQRLRHLLDEAVQGLLLAPIDWRPVASADPEPVCDLLPRVYTECMERARATSPEVARQRIAGRYLRNVLVAGCHDLASVLAWSEKDTLVALKTLEAEGEVAAHPSSRPNRSIFQATATDLLSEP